MNSPAMQILVVALAFLVAGLLAHFVADSRGRPAWEPWVITVVAAALSTACLLLISSSLFVIAMFVIVLAPLPAGAMFLFPQRRLAGEPLAAACPHCREAFIVDPRFGGKPVTCPHCRQLFLGPNVPKSHV